MGVTLVGECVHGVAEFWHFKLDLIRRLHQAGEPIRVGFETDELGLLALAGRERPSDYWPAFPRIFQTREVEAILEYCLDKGILFFGFDCRLRVDEALISVEYSERKALYKSVRESYFGTDEYFTVRDRLMAEAVARTAVDHPQSHLVCLTHNLHIRKNGSQEKDPLICLKSLRENLDELNIPATSIALNARSADYWTIDGKPAHFEIDDPGSLEFESRGEPRILRAEQIDRGKSCYLLARHRESTPAWSNYDQFVLFDTVGPSVYSVTSPGFHPP